ncbi:hypothetical protein Dimus_003697, partial [Dionaea muscipula]
VFEAFNVPLDDKEGEDPVKTDFFEETFVNMCQLKRKNGVWWLSIGANRRRDGVEVEAENVEILVENVEVKNEGGETKEKEAEVKDSGSGEKFYDVVDGIDERPADEDVAAPAVPAAPPIETNVQQKGKTMTTGVDPSGSLSDSVLLHLQVEMDRALKTNTRFHELYQQLKSNPLLHQNPRTHLD